MNREINFRAWDEESKYLLPANQILEIHFEKNEVKWIGGWLVGRDEDSDPQQELCQFNNPILMQFTGLKDKNGKEIYEGDIVRSHWNDTNGEISFGEYEWSEDNDVFYRGCGFHWRNEHFDHVGTKTIKCLPFGRDVEGTTNKFEVIGNVYENPELLAPGK
jgi:uncharacterized phage protein (TIGR01671 family)